MTDSVSLEDLTVYTISQYSHVISVLRGGYPYFRTYFGYTEREARQRFYNEINRKK